MFTKERLDKIEEHSKAYKDRVSAIMKMMAKQKPNKGCTDKNCACRLRCKIKHAGDWEAIFNQMRVLLEASMELEGLPSGNSLAEMAADLIERKQSAMLATMITRSFYTVMARGVQDAREVMNEVEKHAHQQLDEAQAITEKFIHESGEDKCEVRFDH